MFGPLAIAEKRTDHVAGLRRVVIGVGDAGDRVDVLGQQRASGSAGIGVGSSIEAFLHVVRAGSGFQCFATVGPG